jgi:hypothetical protein
MTSLIDIIRNHPETARFLDWPGDFDLGRAEHGEEVHLASGQTLEGFAGDGTGGTYFFCGDGGEERPVLYADSEGSAGLIAGNLAELLRLILVTPWWRDFQQFTEQESGSLSVEYRDDMADFDEQRHRVAEVLGLELATEAATVARLREVFVGGREEFALVFTPEDNRYEPLFDL